MRVVYFLAVLIFSGINAYAQSNLQKEQQQEVKIDPRSTEDFFNYVFDFEVIALKGSDDLILPSLRLIGTTENRIFATTKSFRRNPVYVFDLQGNHIKTIQQFGNGPTEYQGVRGVIDYDKGVFGLEDVLGKKILLFDSLGNYKETKTWDRFNYGIKHGANGYFAQLPEDMYEPYGRVGVLDSSFKLLKGFLNNSVENKSRISSGNTFQSYKGGFAFMEPNTTGIYHGNDQEIWPAYYLNFGPFAPETMGNGIPSFEDKVSLLGFYETDNCIYLEYAFGMRNFQLSVYSKGDGQVITHKLSQLVGEELLGLSTFDDQWMYLSIPAPAIPALLQKLEMTGHTFANGMTGEEVLASENPVILKYRFL